MGAKIPEFVRWRERQQLWALAGSSQKSKPVRVK